MYHYYTIDPQFFQVQEEDVFLSGHSTYLCSLYQYKTILLVYSARRKRTEYTLLPVCHADITLPNESVTGQKESFLSAVLVK